MKSTLNRSGYHSADVSFYYLKETGKSTTVPKNGLEQTRRNGEPRTMTTLHLIAAGKDNLQS